MLTKKQEQVMRLIRSGLNFKEIGRLQNKSHRTVEIYVAQVRKLTGTRTSYTALQECIRRKWLQPVEFEYDGEPMILREKTQFKNVYALLRLVNEDEVTSFQIPPAFQMIVKEVDAYLGNIRMTQFIDIINLSFSNDIPEVIIGFVRAAKQENWRHFETKILKDGNLRALIFDLPDEMPLNLSEMRNDDTLSLYSADIGTIFDKKDRWLVFQLVK